MDYKSIRNIAVPHKTACGYEVRKLSAILYTVDDLIRIKYKGEFLGTEGNWIPGVWWGVSASWDPQVVLSLRGKTLPMDLIYSSEETIYDRWGNRLDDINEGIHAAQG